MDADFKEKRRQRICEKRWSMNSQRLEDILAQLMRPISNLRHCFDTDLCALLEEYLTEAGLHLLEEEDEESEGDGRAGSGVAPNFAELALLLQQSANIYGHKVDFLYQHVLNVSDSLHNSITELTNSNEVEAPETPSPSASKRRRKASAVASGDFTHIELERCGAARRAAEAPRPPPTLPRMYIELEPRVLLDRDAPLTDYAGEPIGLLADFHVSWRLQGGLLVDELEGSSEASAAALRPIPLTELQAALEAAAPPPLSPPPPPLPISSTSLPSPDMPPPPPPPPVKKERKRKREPGDDLPCGPVKILISKELRRELARECEFSLPREWVSRVLARRAGEVLALRRSLRDWTPSAPPSAPLALTDPALAFTGFPGWSALEATAATAHDSDDDGFFEQSSLEHSDSEPSRVDDSLLHPSGVESVEWEAWRSGVVQRAAAAEALGGVDIRALSAAVLGALPPPPAATPFRDVLAAQARTQADVSRLFLAALFLANAGGVKVLPGAPLQLDSFALQVVPRECDEGLLATVEQDALR